MQTALRHRDAILQAWPFVQDAMRPATSRQIAEALERLQVFCFQVIWDDWQTDPVTGEEHSPSQQAWVDGFIESLERIPADILNLACRRWRERKITGNTHPMPSPGQLLGMVDDVWGQRCAIFARARMAVKFLRENPDAVPYVPHRDHAARAKQVAGLAGKIGTTPKSDRPKPRSRDEQIRELLKDQPAREEALDD